MPYAVVEECKNQPASLLCQLDEEIYIDSKVSTNGPWMMDDATQSHTVPECLDVRERSRLGSYTHCPPYVLLRAASDRVVYTPATGVERFQSTQKAIRPRLRFSLFDSDLMSKVPHTEYGGCTPYGPRAEHGATGIQPGSGGVQPSGPTAGR